MLASSFTAPSLRLLLLALTSAASPAMAQQWATSEQELGIKLPQLPDGGDDKAIVRAIQQGVRYPLSALRDQAQGQGLVTFAVSPTGQVCLIHVARPLRPDLDSAIVKAVRQLHALRPAEQHGRPVSCLLTAPVTFLISNPSRLPRKPLPPLDSAQVYDVVTRMPLYKDQPAYQQLAADLAAEYVRRAPTGSCLLPKTGSVAVLATISPSGMFADVQLKRDSPEYMRTYNATFGDQVARLDKPEGTDDFDAACLPLLTEAARSLPRLTPAYVNGQPASTRLLLRLRPPGQTR